MSNKNIYSVPNLRLLKKGILKCIYCSAKYPLSEHNPLELFKCSKCGQLLFNPMRIKNYWLYRPLGAGGMGSVYRGVDIKGKREYAIKVLPRTAKNAELCEELLAEGELGLKLARHPNLTRVFDYGTQNEEYYIVFEFIYGDRLDNIIKTRGAMPENIALDVILQLIDAEQKIINTGYLYRDLKPQNIIIREDGTLKLFDYGLARPIEELSHAKANTADIEGSPLYMPPERILGKPEGEYSEIYSMGMVLFYLLTGRTYYGDTLKAVDIMMKHVNAVRLSSVKYALDHCHPETSLLLDKMIEREPEKRIQDFKKLKTLVKKLLKDVILKMKKNGITPLSMADYTGQYPVSFSFGRLVCGAIIIILIMVTVLFILTNIFLSTQQDHVVKEILKFIMY